MKRFWPVWATIAALILAVSFPMSSSADVATIPIGPFTTSSSSGTTPFYTLTGQGTCAPVLSGTGAGSSVTVIGSANADGSSPKTNANFGTAGVISGAGTYAGSVANLPQKIAFSWTGNTGTMTISGSCTGASLPSSGGGTVAGTVAISPQPIQAQVAPAPGSSPLVMTCAANGCPTPIPDSTGSPHPVNMVNVPNVAITSMPQVQVSGPVPVNNVAVTGNGFTHVAAAPIATSAPQPVQTSAATLAALMFSWNAPTTNTGCWLTVYDSLAAPTVGTAFIFPPVFITTAVPGAFAYPIPPTIGTKIVNGLWVAATTTPTGAVACNTTASQLWFSADLK